MKKLQRINRLKDIRGVHVEMRNLYREARKDELDINTAVKLMSLLRSIASTMEGSNLEQDIEELKQRLEALKPGVVRNAA